MLLPHFQNRTIVHTHIVNIQNVSALLTQSKMKNTICIVRQFVWL